MSATTITRERFEALCYSRTPLVERISEEREWWANNDEKNLGIVLFENPDQQWFWIVLGRDERGVFRCVDIQVSIDTKEEASQLLKSNLSEWETRPEEDSFQGGVNHKKNEIFVQVAKEKQLHPNFKILANLEGYSPARGLIKEIAYAFTDLDGNYIRDFQSSGFAGRLWELYLFAFLYEQRFTITDEFDRPDFGAIKQGFPIAIEATTVNPTDGISAPPHETTEQRKVLIEDYMPIKFGSALYSKLQKSYWELPHMENVPLVFAIHDFHSNDSMTWSSTALHEYLYGIRARPFQSENGAIETEFKKVEEHNWNGKTIPSGFFRQPKSEHVSAVLFSNCATLSKFNRIGKIACFGSPDVHMLRVGDLWNPDPEAVAPTPFAVEVEPEKYSETWSEGVRIFHNPNAIHPIPPQLFPECSHHFEKDGKLVDYLPDHIVFNSNTFITVPKR